MKENIILAQELYSKSFKLKNKRWTAIILPVYNELLKTIDRHELKVDLTDILERNNK
jgi:hypothetical protein